MPPGYDPVYHTGSELQLGDRGWVQIANFLQMGVGTAAFALGVYRVLDTAVGAVLLGIFACWSRMPTGDTRPDPRPRVTRGRVGTTGSTTSPGGRLPLWRSSGRASPWPSDSKAPG